MCCIHNHQITLSRPGSPMLAFQVLGPHAYFFKSQTVAKGVFNWNTTDNTRGQLKRKYQADKQWETPTEWHVDQVGCAGHFFCFATQVDEVRRELLALNIVPKLTLRE